MRKVTVSFRWRWHVRVIGLSVFLAGPIGNAQPQPQGEQPQLCVMTYNLRFATPTGPSAWPERRPLVCEQIRQIRPDVLGTQESLSSQLKEIAAELPDFDWISLGRDGGSRGEFIAVFYRKDRLEPVAFDHFWLSDTPELIGSATWGNVNRRMVTFVRFEDKQTGGEFYLFNTHFDHQSQHAREKSAALVHKHVSALDPNVPVLLVSDFNGAAGASKPFQILAGDGFFIDTWTIARQRVEEGVGTLNNFKAVSEAVRELTGSSRVGT